MQAQAFLDNLQPPQVPLAVVQAYAEADYGLRGEWRRLDGERDQNFRVRDGDGAAWVFRLCNPQEDIAVFDCQVKALAQIGRTSPALPVPRVRQTRDGAAMGTLVHNGQSHCVIVLSYLPGVPVGKTRLAPAQLFEVGQLLARLGEALRGFVHAAPAARHLAWDHRQVPGLLAHVDVLPADQQERARRILQGFATQTLPELEALRGQIIHGDVHPYNLLIEDGTPSGVIDFGDMVHGALVQDLANTIADFLYAGGDNARILYEIIRGYAQVTALEEEELAVLLPLIQTRILMAPLILLLREKGGAATAAYADLAQHAFPLLDEVEALAPRLVDEARRGANFPPLRKGPVPTASALLARRRAIMGERLYMFYDRPVHLVKGDGVWLTAEDGRRYLDCYNNVAHVGHANAYVAEAIHRQARVLNTNTRYLSEQSIEYAERLTATLDPSLTAVVYVNSGSEANDVAWRMAKAWTGKTGGLAMEYAYHGITDAIDPFSPSNDVAHWQAPHLRLLPAPDDYRGPFRRGGNDLARRYADLADPLIADLQASGHGVAAGMVDSAFMTNGIIEVPQGYLAAVVDKIHAAGGLFIADEVQSGFGRMGSHLWGHQHHGVVPDFVTLGKPAGNGHPIGVVITRPEILDHFTRHAPFFSTFGGNNVSCAAGLAVLDVMQAEGLLENAATTGAYFKAELKKLQARHPIIGDVRGSGLALGVELVRDRTTLEPADHETKRIANLMRDEGVFIGTEGVLGNVLKLRPPVVFRPEHADIVVAALDRVLARL